MCHGHPHHHPCGHQSVTWHYCPKALIDLETGYETPCDKTTFAISQPAKTKCPLQNCEFKAHGGSWICCVCKQGPNTQGWCAFKNPGWQVNHITKDWSYVESCDHGCCKNCTKIQDDAIPGSASTTESRKNQASKAASSSHRKGATGGNKSEEVGSAVASSSMSSSSSKPATYDIHLDYGPTKGTGTSSRKKKGQKSRGH